MGGAGSQGEPEVVDPGGKDEARGGWGRIDSEMEDEGLAPVLHQQSQNPKRQAQGDEVGPRRPPRRSDDEANQGENQQNHNQHTGSVARPGDGWQAPQYSKADGGHAPHLLS